jgi:AcrR family transcriptional regulator
MARPSCKEAILDAAESVAIDGGAARLTLDAVAKKAGVSKGGVLYHFPNKTVLLEGMVGRRLAQHEKLREEALRRAPEGPGRELKAALTTQLDRQEHEDRLVAALIAAVANEPEMLSGSAREYHRKRFEALCDGGECSHFKAVLLLAADGLLFLELLQVSPFSGEERAQLIEVMMRLAEQAGNAVPSGTHAI